MSIDATIRREDGEPLGTFAEVQRALTSVFFGVSLGESPSASDVLSAAASQGVTFPDVIREHILSRPPQYEGTYEGVNFSAEFYMSASGPIEEINVVLREETTESEAMFELLYEKFGWVTTIP